jgi:hypothetical protein
MHTEQEPGHEPPPVPRPAHPLRAKPTPRRSGLTLTKLVLAVGILLVLAWFVGERNSGNSDSAQASVSAEPEAPAPRNAGTRSEARVVQGQKSTTLRQVEDARMQVGEQGTVLRIEGSVGRNFATELQAALDANPSLQRIDITSGGGYAQSGLEAARMIRRRNLIVRVHSHCASMCVGLWAAAAQRQMEPDALIGLHQWNAQCEAFPSPAREECRHQIQFMTDHDSSYDAWLRDAGFNQYLLDLQSSTAAEDIAVLDVLQLWENGVDFSVVNRDGRRMSRAEVQQHLAAKSRSR